MNTDIIKGKWKEVKGKLKGRWGRLTDDDLMLIEGRNDELAGVLQQRYGLAKDQAVKESKEFFASCCNSEEAAAEGPRAKPSTGGTTAPRTGRER